MVTEYRKGDYVKYSTNGVCFIEDINSTDFNPKENNATYYILRPLATSGTVIFVPTDNEALVSKMRKILTKEEIDRIIFLIDKEKIEWIDDKKERSIYFNEIIRKDDTIELLRLASCIYLKRAELIENGKKLLASDFNILEHIEKLVVNEFSFVLGIDTTNVGDYIKEKLGIL